MTYAKNALQRQKSVDILKKFIQVNPNDSLADTNVAKCVVSRLTDVSTMTRSSALELIVKNLSNFADESTVDLIV